jgi:phosphatidylethanolamine/phosphatidyl-N-methylethanolamine N-methyltransferase
MPYDHESTFDSRSTPRQSVGWLYFRRFLKHPARLASLTPSSQALGRLVAQHLRREPDEYVVELGCGTGPITRALLDGGVPPGRLIAVDLDRELLAVTQQRFPDITVMECDAARLTQHLPTPVVGRVGTVVCGVPVSLLPRAAQRALVAEMFRLMPAGRRFLAYTHRLSSPLPAGELGLESERLAHTLRNLPPASVWGYGRAEKV